MKDRWPFRVALKPRVQRKPGAAGEVDLEGSHDRPNPVPQRGRKSHRLHLLDHHGARRHAEPGDGGAHLGHRHPALHADRHPIPRLVRVHPHRATHRERLAGRPALPALQRGPVVVRPAHAKRGDPDTLRGEPRTESPLHLGPGRHVPEIHGRSAVPIEEEAAEAVNVADQGNGIVGLLDGVEADLVVGRRRGLRGVGAGTGEENRSGDQAHE